METEPPDTWILLMKAENLIFESVIESIANLFSVRFVCRFVFICVESEHLANIWSLRENCHQWNMLLALRNFISSVLWLSKSTPLMYFIVVFFSSLRIYILHTYKYMYKFSMVNLYSSYFSSSTISSSSSFCVYSQNFYFEFSWL